MHYFKYIFHLIKNPDEVISKEFKGFHKFGLTNIIILILMISINSLVQNIDFNDVSTWQTIDFNNALILAASYALPLVVLLLLLNWVATKVIDKRSIAYYTEKLGAVMLFPYLLVLFSFILKLYDSTLFTWVNYSAFFFMYIGIFLCSYLFAARDNFKVSALFVLGYYFSYKLIYLVLL